VGGGVETAAVSLSPAVASAASSGGRLSVSDVNARSQTCSLKLRRGDERCSSNTSAADGGRLTAFGRTAGDGERPEWWAGGCLSSSSLGASAWGGILGRDSGAKLVAALSTNSCCQPPGPGGGRDALPSRGRNLERLLGRSALSRVGFSEEQKCRTLVDNPVPQVRAGT
jgi:hypothetical protein